MLSVAPWRSYLVDRPLIILASLYDGFPTPRFLFDSCPVTLAFASVSFNMNDGGADVTEVQRLPDAALTQEGAQPPKTRRARMTRAPQPRRRIQSSMGQESLELSRTGSAKDNATIKPVTLAGEFAPSQTLLARGSLSLTSSKLRKTWMDLTVENSNTGKRKHCPDDGDSTSSSSCPTASVGLVGPHHVTW